LYDERLGRNEDYELNCRLRKTGGSIWHDPAIRIFYHHERPLVAMFRKAFLNGQWNPWTWHVAPYSFTWRHAVPAAFVGTIFGACLLSFIEPFFGEFVFGGLLVPYFVIALLASLQQARRSGLWMLPCLPFLFCGYHLIYGLGGLWGMCLLGVGRAPVQAVSEPGSVQARSVGGG
jgi:hypothetical protein